MKTEKRKPSALEKAVELLAAQEQSERRLREKLLRRGYEAEEVDAVIVRLQERHYLDDEAACGRAFRRLYEESSMSVRQIGQKLYAKGYSPELIRASLPEDDDRGAREREAARRALRSRFHAAAPRAKMKQYLYRRGFSYGICDTATDLFLEENPEFKMEETDSYEE